MDFAFAFAPLIIIFLVMYFLLIRPNKWNRKWLDGVKRLAPEQRRKRGVMQDAVLIPVGIVAFLASGRVTAYVVETKFARMSYDDAMALNGFLFWGAYYLQDFVLRNSYGICWIPEILENEHLIRMCRCSGSATSIRLTALLTGSPTTN